MNRKQAVEYDEKLRVQLFNYAKECNAKEDMGKLIVDKYITFRPDIDIKNIVTLGNEPASYKASNVTLDLKKALIAGVEFVASISSPESIFNYIQMIIVTALFIGNITKKPLNKLEAYMVYWLHIKDAYQFGVEEEKLICELQEWYRQKKEKELAEDEIVQSINNLYDMKVIKINDGKIYLKERVFGKME